ncbi:MAG: diacylglycerol kinase [Acidiferrobacterales bacterium]|nr:diacylglycerol kinase [Acidiferrobacterales bacterium]
MTYQKNTGITRVIKAFGYSCQGLVAAWRGEAAFRQEIVLCLVLVPLGLWLGETGTERALLVLVVMLVPVIELLNSAIEAVVDRFGGEIHPLSGQAKDIGSAAVLLSLFIVAIVWALVLL